MVDLGIRFYSPFQGITDLSIWCEVYVSMINKSGGGGGWVSRLSKAELQKHAKDVGRGIIYSVGSYPQDNEPPTHRLSAHRVVIFISYGTCLVNAAISLEEET